MFIFVYIVDFASNISPWCASFLIYVTYPGLIAELLIGPTSFKTQIDA